MLDTDKRAAFTAQLLIATRDGRLPYPETVTFSDQANTVILLCDNVEHEMRWRTYMDAPNNGPFEWRGFRVAVHGHVPYTQLEEPTIELIDQATGPFERDRVGIGGAE